MISRILLLLNCLFCVTLFAQEHPEKLQISDVMKSNEAILSIPFEKLEPAEYNQIVQVCAKTERGEKFTTYYAKEYFQSWYKCTLNDKEIFPYASEKKSKNSNDHFTLDINGTSLYPQEKKSENRLQTEVTTQIPIASFALYTKSGNSELGTAHYMKNWDTTQNKKNFENEVLCSQLTKKSLVKPCALLCCTTGCTLATILMLKLAFPQNGQQ